MSWPITHATHACFVIIQLSCGGYTAVVSNDYTSDQFFEQHHGILQVVSASYRFRTSFMIEAHLLLDHGRVYDSELKVSRDVLHACRVLDKMGAGVYI